MFTKAEIEMAAQEKGLPFSWVEGKLHLSISLGDVSWRLSNEVGAYYAALALLASELGLVAPAHPWMAEWGTPAKVLGASFKPYDYLPAFDEGIGMVTHLFPVHCGVKMAFIAISPHFNKYTTGPRKAEVAVYATEGKGPKSTWKWTKAHLGEINL